MSAPSLLHPPSRLSPADALALAQNAPFLFRRLPNSSSSSASSASSASTPEAILQSVLGGSSAGESADVWVECENLLVSCLRIGDLKSANECLRRMVVRFGAGNDRIMALDGMVREAEAYNKDKKALIEILKHYSNILEEDGSNVPIHKRRAALLRSMGHIPEAVSALVALLEFSPTDAEAWAELADVYLSQGFYPQAIYALEEVLVIVPNAWNMHARLGEVLYMAAVTGQASGEAASQKYAAESLKRFCRSIELCDDYLRGYYGLKLATSFILKNGAKWLKQNSSKKTEGLSLPDTAAIERLSQLATEKLSEIVRRSSAKEPHWRGYDEAEVTAARGLLSEESAQVVR